MSSMRTGAQTPADYKVSALSDPSLWMQIRVDQWGKFFTTVTRTRPRCSAAAVVRQPGADRRRTCPLPAVITGSRGGAEEEQLQAHPGTLTPHLCSLFFLSPFVLVVEWNGHAKTTVRSQEAQMRRRVAIKWRINCFSCYFWYSFHETHKMTVIIFDYTSRQHRSYFLLCKKKTPTISTD